MAGRDDYERPDDRDEGRQRGQGGRDEQARWRGESGYRSDPGWRGGRREARDEREGRWYTSGGGGARGGYDEPGWRGDEGRERERGASRGGRGARADEERERPRYVERGGSWGRDRGEREGREGWIGWGGNAGGYGRGGQGAGEYGYAGGTARGENYEWGGGYEEGYGHQRSSTPDRGGMGYGGGYADVGYNERTPRGYVPAEEVDTDLHRSRGGARERGDWEGGWSGALRGGASGTSGTSAGVTGGYASEAGRPSYAGRGPKGYKRSDARIEEDVNERLMQHPDIDATEIEVKVHDGVVTLAGAVESKSDKRLAEDVTESCFGVSEVRNELRVSRGGTQQEEHRGDASAQGRTVTDREVRQGASREGSEQRRAGARGSGTASGGSGSASA